MPAAGHMMIRQQKTNGVNAMSIKPHFETYRYTTQICKTGSQSIVECRLPGSEIAGILAIYAKAVPSECTCADGEVRYNGKLLLNIVYEDSERKVCRAERGAEFSHHATDPAVTPACFAKADFRTDNVSYRREGSGLYISVIVGAEISVYGTVQAEYLAGGEGIVAKKSGQPIVKTVCVSGESETDDEFDTDYIGDILMHSENVNVGYVTAEAGQIVVSGEISLNLCALKSDLSLCSYERLVPFRLEIPCDEAMPKLPASAKVRVKSAVLTAGTDEEKGKCRMTAELILSADCELYIRDELPACEDAFSPECELKFKKETRTGRVLVDILRFTERVSGPASLSRTIDYSTALQAAVLPRAEITCKRGDNGGEAEGAIFAEVLLCDADGAHRSAELSLPFLFPVSYDADCIAEADATVCGLSVRQRREGEAEAEATLKVTLRLYRETKAEYISEAEEGEAYRENDCAVSIFIPRAGDGLWEIAKQLRRAPEEVEKSNPELKFPVGAGERIFVYRRKC